MQVDRDELITWHFKTLSSCPDLCANKLFYTVLVAIA